MLAAPRSTRKVWVAGAAAASPTTIAAPDARANPLTPETATDGVAPGSSVGLQLAAHAGSNTRVGAGLAPAEPPTSATWWSAVRSAPAPAVASGGKSRE